MNDLPPNDLDISLLQHSSTPADIDMGIARLERAAANAVQQGSSLLLTPECGITGYDITDKDANKVAFISDGPVAQRIAEIARRHSLAILYGFMEADGDNRFNSVQLIDDNGNRLLHYRKTHLWGDLDRQLFSAGDQFAPVISYKGWRLGVLICYDVEFPETVRALALAGAQVVLVPTALMKPFRFVADHMICVRAAESQVYVAYANLVGPERSTIYEGCSTIAGPQGDIIAKAPPDKGALLHVTLKAADLLNIRHALPYHRDRRPELYGSLIERE